MKRILFLILITYITYCAKAQVINDNNISVYKGVYGVNLTNDTVPKVIPLINFPTPVKAFDASSSLLNKSFISSNLHTHIPNQVSIDKNKTVGEIPIIEGTSPTGARTYTIPIDLVSGREGAQPQINVTYISQAGNGILGKGWSLIGLSAITRGNFSIYFDGKTTSAANSINDPFYLDGMRLIKTSQSSSSVFYQSEQGNIIVEGIISGSNIKYFKVRYPNGGTAVLGYPYQLINTNVYPIIQYMDIHSNIIDYNYDHIGNQFRIKDFAYGRNSTQGGSNYASVHFNYISRDDTSFSWHMGVKSSCDYLLSSIICKDNSTPIRTYTFSYTGLNQKLLDKINCNINGSELNPLKFYYGEDDQIQAINKLTTDLGSWFANTTVSNLAIKKGKFSAWSEDDGLIVYPPKTPYYEYYKHSTWVSHSVKKYMNLMSPDQDILVYHGLGDAFCFPQKTKTEAGFIDMFAADIDGVADEEVVKVNLNLNGSKDKVDFRLYKPLASAGGLVLWKTKSFETATTLDWQGTKSVHPKFFYSGDFNGDGRHEVFAVSCNQPLGKTDIHSRCYLYDLHNGIQRFDGQVFDYNVDFSTSDNNDIIIPFDYDSDGKTDIGLINASGLHIYTFNINGSSYSMSKVATYSGITRSVIKNKKFLLGDFNADGKVDFIVSPTESYTSSNYIQMPVNAPHRCPSCKGLDPVAPGTPFTEFRYNCRYCNQRITPSDRCYDCDRILEFNGGGELLRSAELQPKIAPIELEGGIQCPVHGSTVLVSRPNYVDNGKRWTIHYGKGNGYFETKVVDVKNNDRDDTYVLQDMNGDGTTDLVCATKSGNVSIYPARKGSLSTEKLSGAVNVGSDTYLVPSIIANGNYHSQILALNNNKIHKLRYTINETGQQLLTGVVNSFGIVSKTRYELMNSGDYGLYSESYGSTFPYQKFCGPIYLTAEIQTWLNNTKRAHQTFSYYNALIHMHGLGFRGFERISTNDEIRNQTSINYYDPLKFGILTKQESPLATITNQYYVSVVGNKIAKINLDKKTTIDKLKSNTLTSTYTYDSYGSPTSETLNYGSGLSTTTNITYSNTNSSGIYLLGLPLTKTVSETANGNTFTSKSEWSYSGYRPINTKTYANNNIASDITYEYDGFGNITKKKEKAFSSSKLFTTSFKYDANSRYLTESTNFMNQKTTFVRDALGQVTSETNFKSKTINYTYDKLGRQTQVALPDGEINNYSYSWDSNDGDYLHKLTTSSNVSPSTTEHFDAYGRSLRRGVIGLNGGWTYTDNEYDSKGQVSKQSVPYVAGGSKLWNIYAYDLYGRPTSVTEASGSVTSYSYSGNSVTTSKAGRTSTKTSNARGDMVSSSDPGGTIIYNIRGDGQPVSIIAPGGIQTSFEYDAYGRKTKMIDPSGGTVQYQYDADGNINKVIDGNNKTISSTYNQYNRLKQKVSPEFTSTYIYNSDGLLSSSSSSNGTSISYTYNSLLQLTAKTEIIDGNSYTETYVYQNGRLSSTTYAPLNYTVNYDYNTNNHLASLIHDGTALWTVNTQDVFGNLTKQTLGNGVVVTNNYNTYGMPTEIKSVKGGSVLQHFGYDFNTTTGNLRSRSDQKRNLAESFDYDNLDRLTKCTALGAAKSVNYLSNGNIASTSELGTYTYGVSNKPYAVSGVENTSGIVPDATQNITYTSFKRPSQISEGSVSVNYKYNDAYYRAKTSTSNNGSNSTKYSFAEGKYEKEIKAGITTERLYIGGSPYRAPVVIEKRGTTLTTLYIHRDHLGSITHITNQNGNLEAEYSYTAWGRLRNPTNWQTYGQGQEPTLRLDRGYTGHEHLLAFGLINMNGRVYDPLLKRFLSPDNYVQLYDFTQNFNRFGYCLNNPLIYTDPDGEFIVTAFLIGLAVSAVIDYGIQVAMNYANGYSGKDAWFNKVDFFDVAVSGAIGGLTAGWGASIKAGETVGKVGMFMVNNAKYVTAGEVLLTSAVDITGEGWQDVSFDQFGQRAVTGLATMYASDIISERWKANRTSIEQRVDNAINDATDASNPIGRRGNPIDIAGGTNLPTTINGRNYSGHALDRMQGRGIMPSVIEEAIKNPLRIVRGNKLNTWQFFGDGLKVIINQYGDVITVIPQ
ncbi:RHS repeat-associated core domain-containing protein [Labilibaculum manganireducens]|uniref:RHS repeat-associated core domain-containing protein n=1 Tax=Labilibaculum manganireducens TaxID=1940525 RepID=UPI0029F56CFF|nr:RHS repeat-associated core domain-containing protein [Labilibaculum manganireducens]